MLNREKEKKKTISEFLINLSEKIWLEKDKKIIGREKEIREIVDTLGRTTRKNPLLIGHPGVGKTSIVKKLVWLIENREVPEFLQEKEILQLNVLSLISSANFPGILEERIKKIVEYVENNDVILFIDNIHSFFGGMGNMIVNSDISLLLKAIFSIEKTQCIAIITNEEYFRIERDKTLSKNFNNIYISEPDIFETKQIIFNFRNSLEKKFQLKITDEALETAINLSSKYILDSYFPVKVIDILEETCSKVKNDLWYDPEIINIAKKKFQEFNEKKEREKKILDYDVDVEEIESEKEEKTKLEEIIESEKKEREKIQQLFLLKEEIEREEKKVEELQRIQNYDEAGSLKYVLIPKLENELTKLENEVKKNVIRNYFVGKDQIANTIARKKNVSLGILLSDEKTNMLSLLPSLQQRIKGQDKTLRIISDSIFRVRAGIQNPKTPLFSFLFLGPTGVGKTETALTISEKLFGKRKALYRFNMSEFSEQHSVSKILGSPPGYIGFEQSSLFEKIIGNPNCVLLFDEIEKAHRDIYSLFLQVLDDGVLRLANGKEVNFRNCIIILTSNLAAEIFFEEENYEKAEERILLILKRRFLPEFLNRLDEIIFFHPLNEETAREIVVKELKSFVFRIEKEKKIRLNFSPKIIKKILDEAFSLEFGARPIKHYIEKKVGALIAKNIIFNVIKEGGFYLIDIDSETQEMKLLIISYLENIKFLKEEKK